MKQRVILAGIEIAWHPFARDGGKKREGMPERNVFAERHEMKFAINLHPLAGIRDEQRRIVVVSIFHIERTQQQVRFC